MIDDEEIMYLRTLADEHPEDWANVIYSNWAWSAKSLRTVCDAAIGGHAEARRSLSMFYAAVKSDGRRERQS